jgi:hypothetical protein
MRAASEYRKYAERCKESARNANSDAVRTQFLELAKVWLAAATELDLRANGAGKTTRSGIDRLNQHSSE